MQNKQQCNTVDDVIEYIRKSIEDKTFLPGDRLPSERKLSDMLGIGRPHIRAELKKLELYGILKTFPQSGTVVAEFTKDQMDKMITNALRVSQYDFRSLVHVRVLLEIEACKLAARNRTEDDIREIEKTLDEFEQTQSSEERVEKDFAFHQSIARSSHNPVISMLLLTITPDIMRYYHKFRFCASPRNIVRSEHREYLQKIKDKDAKGMKELVLRHLANMRIFAKDKTSEKITGDKKSTAE